MKRQPPKSRRRKADCPHDHRRERLQRARRDDREGHSAPSHLGGQFDDAGYGPSGGFGFQAHHPEHWA